MKTPAKERNVQTTFHMPDTWEQRIMELAERIGGPIPVSQSAIIRLAVGRGLDLLEREQAVQSEVEATSDLDHLENQIEIVDDHVRKIEGEVDSNTQQLIRIEKMLETLVRKV